MSYIEQAGLASAGIQGVQHHAELMRMPLKVFIYIHTVCMSGYTCRDTCYLYTHILHTLCSYITFFMCTI